MYTTYVRCNISQQEVDYQEINTKLKVHYVRGFIAECFRDYDESETQSRGLKECSICFFKSLQCIIPRVANSTNGARMI